MIPPGPPRRRAGSLRCAGLLLPAPSRDPEALRALLRRVSPGDRLLRLPAAPADEGPLVLVFADVSGDTRMPGPLPGLDRLAAAGPGLSALDGEACPVPGGVLWAEAGRRVAVELPARGVDPAALVDLGAFARVAAPALGPPPALPADPPPEAPAARAQRLGLWSAEAAAQRAAAGAGDGEGSPVPARWSRVGEAITTLGGWLTRALLRARSGAPGRPPPAAGPALGSRLRALPLGLQAALMGLAGLGLGAVALLAGAAAGLAGLLRGLLRGQRPARAPAAAPAAPGLFARLRDAFAAFAPLARLWTRLRGAQARYLAGLVQRLRDAASTAELLEALRHAIPLGGEPGGLEAWLFGRLGAREPGQLGGGGRRVGVRVGEEVAGLLKRLYLDAHRRLDAEGDLERAAWVLAELLREPAQAVAYLEQRGALALAARFAEALDQPAEDCLRLWVMAGDPGRALRIGLARGALGAAVAALEGPHPWVADALRWAHADALEAMGDLRGAVGALWPALWPAPVPGRAPAPPEVVAARRVRLRGLLRHAAAGGGEEAGWAHAFAVALDPPQGGAGGPPLGIPPGLGPLGRLRVAEGWLQARAAGPIPGPDPLAEPLLRALLVDLGGPTGASASAALRAIGPLARGPAAEALVADLPRLPPTASARVPLLWTGLRALRLPPDGGGPPVQDVLPLDHGGVVAALGGLGHRLIRPGAPPRLLPLPAERLLPLPGGWLCLSRAGPDLRVGRAGPAGRPEELGLLPGAAGALGLARVSPDGLLLLPLDGGLCALWPDAGGLRRLWSSGPLPGPGAAGRVRALDLDGDDLRALIELPTGDRLLWRWSRGAAFPLRERRGVLPDARLGPGPLPLLAGSVLYEVGGGHERIPAGAAGLQVGPVPPDPVDLEALAAPAFSLSIPLGLQRGLLIEARVDGDRPVGLRLRRLSAPAVGLCALRLDGPARCLAVDGDHAWVGGAGGGLWRVDLHSGALVGQARAG